MGNLLHMVEFSTLGMVLLDGIPSEGPKASCFLQAYSATRKLMYAGLPRRDNVGSFTIAVSLNAVSLPLFPWSMSFRPHILNGLPGFMWEGVSDSSNTLQNLPETLWCFLSLFWWLRKFIFLPFKNYGLSWKPFSKKHFPYPNLPVVIVRGRKMGFGFLLGNAFSVSLVGMWLGTTSIVVFNLEWGFLAVFSSDFDPNSNFRIMERQPFIYIYLCS